MITHRAHQTGAAKQTMPSLRGFVGFVSLLVLSLLLSSANLRFTTITTSTYLESSSSASFFAVTSPLDQVLLLGFSILVAVGFLRFRYPPIIVLAEISIGLSLYSAFAGFPYGIYHDQYSFSFATEEIVRNAHISGSSLYLAYPSSFLTDAFLTLGIGVEPLVASFVIEIFMNVVVSFLLLGVIRNFIRDTRLSMIAVFYCEIVYFFSGLPFTPNSVSIVLSLVAIYFVTRDIRQFGRVNWALAGLAGAVVVFTHPQTGFLLAALGFALFFYWRKTSVASLLIIPLVFVAWNTFISTRALNQSLSGVLSAVFGLNAGGVSIASQGSLNVVFGYNPNDVASTIVLHAFFVISVCLLLCSIILARHSPAGKFNTALLLAMVIFVPPAALGVGPRYVAQLYPFLTLGAALGLFGILPFMKKGKSRIVPSNKSIRTAVGIITLSFALFVSVYSQNTELAIVNGHDWDSNALSFVAGAIVSKSAIATDGNVLAIYPYYLGLSHEPLALSGPYYPLNLSAMTVGGSVPLLVYTTQFTWVLNPSLSASDFEGNSRVETIYSSLMVQEFYSTTS